MSLSAIVAGAPSCSVPELAPGRVVDAVGRRAGRRRVLHGDVAGEPADVRCTRTRISPASSLPLAASAAKPSRPMLESSVRTWSRSTNKPFSMSLTSRLPDGRNGYTPQAPSVPAMFVLGVR